MNIRGIEMVTFLTAFLFEKKIDDKCGFGFIIIATVDIFLIIWMSIHGGIF